MEKISGETLQEMRAGAFRLFEEGCYSAVIELARGLSRLGPEPPDLLLLVALSLNELGRELEANEAFARGAEALEEARRRGGVDARRAEAALAQCKRAMPGGRDSRQTRAKLALAAARFQPRLPKKGTV